jgi:hypothetical protein
MGNLSGFSSGIGYNFGATKLDLSYTATQRDSNQLFFNKGFSKGADINTTINTITATLLFEL